MSSTTVVATGGQAKIPRGGNEHAGQGHSLLKFLPNPAARLTCQTSPHRFARASAVRRGFRHYRRYHQRAQNPNGRRTSCGIRRIVNHDEADHKLRDLHGQQHQHDEDRHGQYKGETLDAAVFLPMQAKKQGCLWFAQRPASRCGYRPWSTARTTATQAEGDNDVAGRRSPVPARTPLTFDFRPSTFDPFAIRKTVATPPPLRKSDAAASGQASSSTSRSIGRAPLVQKWPGRRAASTAAAAGPKRGSFARGLLLGRRPQHNSERQHAKRHFPRFARSLTFRHKLKLRGLSNHRR